METQLFTAQCTLVQSAVLRWHVVRLSDVGDCDHMGWKSWKLIATGNQPNTFALCGHKMIYVLPGEHGEIWGRLEVG